MFRKSFWATLMRSPILVIIAGVISAAALHSQSVSAGELRILTWNTNGDNEIKGKFLKEKVDDINIFRKNKIGVLVTQESSTRSDSEIFKSLGSIAKIGGIYHHIPKSASERPMNQGKAYLSIVSKEFNVSKELTQFDIRNDAIFKEWLNSSKYSHPTLNNKSFKEDVRSRLNGLRRPAFMELIKSGPRGRGGEKIRLITWHAPLNDMPAYMQCQGQGNLAPYDVFLFLERSSLIVDRRGIDLIVIAGDLNLKSNDFNRSCQHTLEGDGKNSVEYRPFENFKRSGNHLDHILTLATSNKIQNLDLKNDQGKESIIGVERRHSDHDMFTSTVVWELRD